MALAVCCAGFVQAVPCDAVEASLPSCVPTSAQLGRDATLAAHAGSYQVTLVRRDDAVDTASVRGSLVLYPQVLGFETLGNASTPLFGTADVNLGAVGAHRVGDTLSDSAAGPGVLVLEFERAGVKVILLRLGAAANRRDTMLADGAYTVMVVHEISADGFSGSWRSGSHSSRSGGYFCATRTP